MKQFLIAISVCFAFLNIAIANDAMQLDIIERGSYKSEYGPPTIDSEGIHRRDVKKLVLLDDNSNVTADIGTIIGYKYRISSPSENETVELTRVILLPGIKPPGKEFVYKISETFKRTTGKVYRDCWGFGEKWELVPGKYIFQMFYKGKKLSEIMFNVSARK